MIIAQLRFSLLLGIQIEPYKYARLDVTVNTVTPNLKCLVIESKFCRDVFSKIVLTSQTIIFVITHLQRCKHDFCQSHYAILDNRRGSSLALAKVKCSCVPRGMLSRLT